MKASIILGLFLGLDLCAGWADAGNPAVLARWPGVEDSPIGPAVYTLNGNRAYIADSTFGFRTADISVLRNLSFTGGFRTNWTPSAICSLGTLVAVLDSSESRVTLIEGLDPLRPGLSPSLICRDNCVTWQRLETLFLWPTFPENFG